jgi:excinuclease ABC subunit C
MLNKKLNSVPKKPGVYLLKDDKGKMLYVGKAKALRDRLRSHFRPGTDEDRKHRLMMSRIADFETIVTDSEVEALILEASLVREHRPKYNINLKDDKSYPYIRLTAEHFPRIFITRKIVQADSRYFGPYTDVGAARQLMAAIRRIFPVRTCRLRITEETVRAKKHKVCLNYHIGRCRGPCEGLISQSDYRWYVDQVVAFIQGRNNDLIRDLENKMKKLSKLKRFEEAALIRDEVRSIAAFQSKQKIVDGLMADRDLITVASQDDDACAVVFNVRDGKITNRHHFYLKGVEGESENEILTSFLKQYYLRSDYIPKEIYLTSPLTETSEVKEWLSRKKSKKVELFIPKKGNKARLMDMCARNAQLLLEELRLQKEQTESRIASSVEALQKDLSLGSPPSRIEAFDVSNIAGQDAVASMVVFENGRPKKSDYRKFKIKTVDGIDDFRMMAEVIERRMSRLLKEEKALPDLILVDGGKGQLSAAVQVLKKLSLPDQPVIGLAKRLEEVFIPGIPDPQNIPKSSTGLRLLQRVRDEAHRFAVTYHRQRRKKRVIHSELDDIPGIGEKRRNALLKAFGSVEAIREASVENIAKIDSMNRPVAEKIKKMLNET